MTILEKLKITAQKIISIFQIKRNKAEPLETPDQFSPEYSPDQGTFLAKVEESFLSYLEKLGLACWIEIITNFPKCTYYFGPFASASEAEYYLRGYLEDLEDEKAQIVGLNIKRGTPRKLTISEEEMENDGVDLEFSTFVSAELGA